MKMYSCRGRENTAMQTNRHSKNLTQFQRYSAVFIVLGAAILSLFAVRVHATTVALSPVAKQQFFSSAGVPLAAGCIYTYAGGTTTPLASYVDSTGTTQNTDPIQLDSGGFANIWLTGVAYKFAVYQNPPGTACPGTPGGALVLQYTVDNITTSTGSGSGAATSVVSAGANPATSGIIQMTKSDTVCWRNVGNSANACLSIDGANNLTWTGGSLALTEIAAPSGVAGEDIIWADSTAHRLKQSGNGGSAAQLVNAGADINTSDQVTVTHLAAALPVAQGGTGVTTSTGSGNVVLSTSPALTTPSIGGITMTVPPEQMQSSNITGWNGTALISGYGFLTNAHVLLRIYAHLTLQAAGCSTAAVVSYRDETASSNLASLTIANGTTNFDSGVLSVAMPAGHTFAWEITTGPVGCSPTAVGWAIASYQ